MLVTRKPIGCIMNAVQHLRGTLRQAGSAVSTRASGLRAAMTR
jgi:hypothetical protein